MITSPRFLKVFLCYTHKDTEAVHELHRQLMSEGVDPWMYEKNLLPGQDLEIEIPKAVKQSDLVIVCLSKGFKQDGHHQREVRNALKALELKSPETIFIIPALLEECDVPDTFERWHSVKLFEKDGLRRLLRTVTVRSREIGASAVSLGNPFRGLRPFREQDAEVFQKLGRSVEVEKVLTNLNDPNIRAVMIYGDPGVGKTSLIHAGVLPRIEDDATWVVQHLKLGEINLEDPNQIDAFIKKISDPFQKKYTTHLLVCDQIEYWYEQSKIASQAVMQFLSTVVAKTPFKLLIGIRQEYVLEFDTGEYFVDRNTVSKIKLRRLNIDQAAAAIVDVTKGIFSQEAASKVVLMLVESEQISPDGRTFGLQSAGPYTPYIQIVCQSLWERLILEQKKPEITAEDINKENIQEIITSYLDTEIPPTEPPELGAKILRSLVKRGHEGNIVPNPMSMDALAKECYADQSQVRNFIHELRLRDLVYFRRKDGEWAVQIMNDFLGSVIFEKYNFAVLVFQQAIDSLMESFGIILNAEMDETNREMNILIFAQDFLAQRYPAYENDLTGQERSAVLDRFTLKSNSSRSLIKRLVKDGKLEKARLVLDVVYQMLLLLRAYEKIEEFCINLGELARENLSQDYASEQCLLWQSMLENSFALDEKHPDYIAMQHILRAAQQEREYTFVELQDRLKAFKISRLPLWRLLYRLWQDDQVGSPETSDGFQALFSYNWVLSPDRPYLEKYKAIEDLRTYQGVLVHIPAGEHAMRNQRVARQWLIRTVAAERSSRNTAPGWHEADDKKIIDSYSDEKFSDLLYKTAQDYAVMLNEPKKKMWVILEAQEYQIEKMVEICRRTNEKLRKEERSFEGAIVTDIGASIANRKDLTRGVATLAGVPQPAYIILALKPESKWQNIWQKAIEQPGLVKWLPDSWETLSDTEKKKIWIENLRSAIDAVGGNAMVKPITTEFLKGATPASLKESDLELAWERAHKAIGFPSVVVEKLITNIRKELLVIVVRRADGTYVSVPPIWYRCTQDFDWQSDSKHQSVPVAMDYAWVNKDPQPQDSQDIHDLWENDKKIYDEAWAYSKRVAETLWSEIQQTKNEVNNHFLEFEWLVLENGEVLLNEIKPTQLDKGIISNYAFDYSDSDLLVRNLFDLPLPEKVRLIRPQETILCGAVLTTGVHDVQMITQRRQLIGYDNISDALELGVQVFLYSDKMRSLPYIGRRMGILTVSQDMLEKAEKLFFKARSLLKPRYETH